MSDEIPFDAGFDAMPEITHEEALTAEVDEMLGEIADVFDEVATDLQGFVDSELTAVNVGVTQIRNTLDGVIATETIRAERLESEVVRSITDVVDDELRAMGDLLRTSGLPDPPDEIEPPDEDMPGEPDQPVPMPDPEDCGNVWGVGPDNPPIVPPFGAGEPIPSEAYFGLDTRGWLSQLLTPTFPAGATAAFLDAAWGFFPPDGLWVIHDDGVRNPIFEYFIPDPNFVCGPDCPPCQPCEVPEPCPEQLPCPEPEPEPEHEHEEHTDGSDCDHAFHVKICPTDVALYCDSENDLLIVSKIDEAEEEWTKVASEESKGIDLDELVRICRPETPGPVEEAAEEFMQLLNGVRGGCVLPDAGIMDAAGIEAMLDAIRGIQKPAAGLTILETILKLMGKNTTGWGLPLLIITTLMLVGVKEARAIWRKVCGGNDLVMRAVFSRSVSAFLDRLMPGAFAEQMGRQSQIINNECPWQVPEVDQAIAAWRTGYLSANDRDCYIRANGFRSDLMRPFVNATALFPTMFEASMGLRRGLIVQGQFEEIAARNGLQKIEWTRLIHNLTEQVPPPTDLIRYMVRDADDRNVVTRFKLDDQFPEKFRPDGQLKKWADDQGVTEEQMRYSWRAHWTIPSPGQLFEIFHRVGRRPDGAPIPEIEEDVKQALIQQDILPFWIPRLLATSFRLPTQRQIGRAFRVGVFSESDVLESYVRLGYETQTAQAFTRFTLLEARRVLLTNPFVKNYARGEINAIDLRKELAKTGATKTAINDAVDRGELLSRIDSKKACLAAVKHKVMIGEITQNEAAIEVFDLTDQSPNASNLVKQWFCERDSRSKTSTASQLCAFFTDGIIDAVEFHARLIRVGFIPDTATALVQRCVLQLQRRIAKAELAQLKAQAAAAARAVNQAKREEAKRVSDESKGVKARIAARKAREARQKELLSASKTLSNKIGIPVEDVFSVVRRTHNLIVQRGIATAEKSAQDAKDLASAGSVLNLSDWQDALLDVLVSGPVA